jgi:hypothetical protein
LGVSRVQDERDKGLNREKKRGIEQFLGRE